MTTRKQKERRLRLLREKSRRKAAASFEYFVQEWCWIEGKEEGVAIPFKLWPAQKRILPTFLSALLLIILKARQLGLTWLTAAYCLWFALFHPGKLIIVISAKEEWAVEFLDRCKFILNRLPLWMIPEVEKESGQQLRFVFKRTKHGKVLESSDIKSLATTVEGAQSKTPDVLVMDETARNRYAKQIFASSKPGIDKAGGRIIVISNSHKDGVGWGWTRGIYVGAMKGLNKFARVFMPWWDCPQRPRNFKALQLESGIDEDDFSQNYPETEEEAISAMAGSYFGKTLARHESECLPGVRGWLKRVKSASGHAAGVEFEEDKKGIVEIWRYPYHLVEGWDGVYWTDRYAAGSDVSEGLGQSNSVAYVIDRSLDELVCKVCSNRLDAVEWAEQCKLLTEYYCSATDESGTPKDALICVERTGAGQTTVKELSKVNANQYVREVTGKIGSGMTKEFGWHESEQSKHLLCGDLKAWFRNTTGGFYDGQLIDEASTTIKYEGSNRIGPEDGKMWDTVVSAGCAIQASMFVARMPMRLEPKEETWLDRLQREGGSNWAV